MPPARIFSLIIGIDNYKSGHIWNLHACVEDAKKIKKWLLDEFGVPRDQICLLLDSRATKSNIENAFMAHLVNNSSIDPGDAILIYFAGHGSSMLAPSEWYEAEAKTEMVEVLCPYDHDTKAAQGRVAGISDRSFHAMIQDLANRKGNNVTVVLDCCFSPFQTPANILQRSTTRWSKTTRAEPDDLYRGLWPSAREKPQEAPLGFSQLTPSHIALLAASPGQRCTENKDGGRFTTNFLYAMSGLPLHRTSYVQLMEHLQQSNEGAHTCICSGKHRDRILFDGVPFLTNNHFLRAGFDNKTGLIKIIVGAVHGIVEGTEFSLHLHNYHYSRNPSIATVIVSDVQASWCFARYKSRPATLPTLFWAQMAKWNNRRPFRVHLESSLTSFFRTWKLRKTLPTSPDTGPAKNQFQVLRVKRQDLADISLSVEANHVAVTQHTLPQPDTRTVHIHSKNPVDVINDAARFNMHLLRNNVDKPLHNLIDMEIWRIDHHSWLRISGNHLKDGTAIIPQDDGSVYQINLHNKSNIDIWPTILYMDPSRYEISTTYCSASCSEAPLRSRGSFNIGSGEPGSEALTFPLDDYSSIGFMKLFFSSVPVSMSILEQCSFSPSRDNGPCHGFSDDPSCLRSDSPNVIWDTTLVPLVLVHQEI